MALIRSLTSGTSALKAEQQRMDVISNNIANVNTTGYKASTASFLDQFNQTFSLGTAPGSVAGSGIGGVDPLQIGLGVKLGAVKMDFTQGSVANTSRNTDVALQGDGFFALQRNNQTYYSRAGSFSFDRNGYLLDSSTGSYVQGYNLQTNANGVVQKDVNGANTLDRSVAGIKVQPTFKSAPKQTQTIAVSGNVGSTHLSTDPAVKTSITIYDTQGGQHQLNLAFQKTAVPNQYTMQVTVDSVATNLNTTAGAATNASQPVTFNADGTLSNIGGTTSQLTFQVNAATLNAALGTPSFNATEPKNLTISLASPNDLTGGMTQYAAADTVNAKSQDGYSAGDIKDISIDQTGKINGAFTNGQSEVLGQLVVAKFTNPSGLVKEGANMYTVSPNSGLAQVGTAGETFPSTAVAGKSLEESNVDLTSQFTDLISTQRAFEAASRTVTISDQFLQEINSLKR